MRQIVAAVTQVIQGWLFELRQSGACARGRFYDGLLEHWNNWKHFRLGFWVWPPASRIRGSPPCAGTHGLWDSVRALQTGRPAILPKPHPANGRKLAICREAGAAPGNHRVFDRRYRFDMAMAVNAKGARVGVDWGYHDEHELIRRCAE